MLYTSPTIHKLEIGDIIRCREESGLNIFDNKPVIFLGQQKGGCDIFIINEGKLIRWGFAEILFQQMINDEEIEVWTK